MRNFEDWLREKKSRIPNFDDSDLSKQFIPYFCSGQRIIVKTRYGETKRGYVGVTTGWKPCFLLMHNTRAIGSSTLLMDGDQIIGTVKKWRCS
jgi:hypothetical protein